MERRAALRLICGGFAAVAAGCADRTAPAPARTTPPARRLSVTAKPVTEPISDQEVRTFLNIVSHLPEGQVPEFNNLGDPPQLAGQPVREFVAELRRDYQQRLDADVQGRAWGADPFLSQTFRELEIDPAAFASLATRISVSHSALAIREKVPLAATRRDLVSRIESLISDLEAPLPHVTDFTRRHHVGALREVVALYEFLTLLQQVPQESLQVVTEHRAPLEPLLPLAESIANFERREEFYPEVQQIGHTAP